MEKRFVIFTSPVNEKLMKTATDEFFFELSSMFKCVFNRENTWMEFSVLMSPAKVHIFEDSDYIGWLSVVKEGHEHEAVSTHH